MGSLPMQPNERPDGKWNDSCPSWDIPATEYPQASKAPFPTHPAEWNALGKTLLMHLNHIFATEDYHKLPQVMNTESSFWRDHLCLNDRLFRTLSGAKDVISIIKDLGCAIESIELDRQLKPGQIDFAGKVRCLSGFITIRTKIGSGRGSMKLIQDINDADQWKIYTIYTCLWELKLFPESDYTGSKRPRHATPTGLPPKMNWKHYVEEKQRLINEDPVVLIVGAGHCGMMMAARLGILGINTLVIDRQERNGDSWRLRYRNLCLHDPCWMNTMPYVPYPPNWPIFCPKDKLADFLESYASIMELNIWNKTTMVNSYWNREKKQWTVVLESSRDGKVVRTTFHPRHLIQATGLNGAPRIPDFQGMSDFEGHLIHSSKFRDATDDYAGKNVIIVGTGNSAHDIAYDAYLHGANVTMVQRGSTLVKTVGTSLDEIMVLYNENIPTADSDVLILSTPITVFTRFGYDLGALAEARDKPILDGLTKAGFSLPGGPKYLNNGILAQAKGGGFYLDIGCSQVIADGGIKIKQGQEIKHITKNSMVFADGSEIIADEIVMATGYKRVRERTREMFGDSVADAIEPIGGLDQTGEPRGVWKRTGHPGFWVAAGAFYASRHFSRLLAMQIKAIEEGISEL